MTNILIENSFDYFSFIFLRKQLQSAVTDHLFLGFNVFFVITLTVSLI